MKATGAPSAQVLCCLTALFLFFLLTLLQLPPPAKSASAAPPVPPRLRPSPLPSSPPLTSPTRVCLIAVKPFYRPAYVFTGIRAALRKAREVFAALEALEEVLENDS